MLSLTALASIDYISAEQFLDEQTEHNQPIYSTYSPYLIQPTTSKFVEDDAALIDETSNYDETINPISIYQRIDKGSVLSGEAVNYTITYRNNLGLEAKDVIVTDILPEIEYYAAEPAPTYVSGNILAWIIGDLKPGEMGSIELTVDLNDDGFGFVFKESQSASGKGFVRIHKKISTTSDYKNTTFTNYVNITANYNGIAEHSSDSSSIEVINGIKPEIRALTHGSGTYFREDKIEIDVDEGNGRIDDELSASYAQESFALPANRSIDFKSKWSERVVSNDDLMDFSSSEKYMYAENIDRESRFKVENKESSLKFDVNFKGAGSIDMRVGESAGSNRLSGEANPDGSGPALKGLDAEYISKEDYLGNYSLSEKINLEGDSYQKRIDAYRTVSGNGSVFADKIIKSSQRSYESGTGNYQVNDIIKTGDNNIIKDINVIKTTARFTYTPNFNISLSKGWEEGLISGSASRGGSDKRGSLRMTSRSMAEKYSNIDYLKKSSEIKGLNEMKTTADFSGHAEFKVQAEISNLSRKTGQTFILQEYSGRFNLTRNIKIVGAPKYNRPHLSISKTGRADLANNTFVDYTMQITNDGDSVLNHIIIQDFLPPGTSYVRSSLKPRDIRSDYINWTVPVSLDVGESYNIDLRLNINEKAEYLINQAYAYMVYNEMLLKSKCISRLQLDWPELNSLPESAIKMSALIDDQDPMIIKYSITLENYYEDAITANPFCTLPGKLTFLNSSTSPKSNTSTNIIWSPIILSPGENKTIELWARASENGTFVSKSTIKVIGLKFPAVKVAIAAADINEVKAGGIEREYAQINNLKASGWEPPTCFGLICTQETCYENDWYSCFDLDANDLIE